MSGESLVVFFTSFSMWTTISPIIFCSIVALAVAVERFIFYRRIDLDYELILRDVVGSAQADRVGEGRALCRKYPGPITAMVEGILERLGPEFDREGIILGNARKAIVRIEKYVGVISTIATISPMLGLFGTVTGLLKAFTALSRGGADASSQLAYGVAEALLTTILGLLVAMPSWVFYNYMVARVDYFIKEIERISNRLMKI
jgi:biopolymer transport protein ExbB